MSMAMINTYDHVHGDPVHGQRADPLIKRFQCKFFEVLSPDNDRLYKQYRNLSAGLEDQARILHIA